MADLDPLDHIPLPTLHVDGRVPVAGLARDLGVTRTTITHRTDTLIGVGVTLGSIVQTAERVDAVTWTISYLAIGGPYVEETIRILRKFPEVMMLHTMSGEWDPIVEIMVTKLVDTDAVLSVVRDSPDIHRSKTSILLRSMFVRRVIVRSSCGPDAASFLASVPESRWKPVRNLALTEYFTKLLRASEYSKGSAVGTPYTVVHQALIVASVTRIFLRIEDFQVWRVWSSWRRLGLGVREGYSALSFSVDTHYRWSGNREAGAGLMTLTRSDPPRQHSDLPRIIEIDLVFTKPFPSRSRIESILDEKCGQVFGEWRSRGESTGAT